MSFAAKIRALQEQETEEMRSLARSCPHPKEIDREPGRRPYAKRCTFIGQDDDCFFCKTCKLHIHQAKV